MSKYVSGLLVSSTSDNDSMNKKLLIIPTIILSSALLLTGCTSGKTEPGKGGSPNPSSTSSVAPDVSDQPIEGYVAPPENLKADYRGFYMAPTTVNEVSWGYYKNAGATTYKEDSSVRSTTESEIASARDDMKNLGKFDKMYGEISSDVEQSALNISSYLETNKTATVDDINNNKDLVINRYTNAGSTVVEKDSATGFFFVIFTMNKAKGATYGILVPQKDITPDFETGTSSQ